MTTRGRLANVNAAPRIHFRQLIAPGRWRVPCQPLGRSAGGTTLDPEQVTCATLACRRAQRDTRNLIAVAQRVQHASKGVLICTPWESLEIEVQAMPGGAGRPFNWTVDELFAVRVATMSAAETLKARAALYRKGIPWNT